MGRQHLPFGHLDERLSVTKRVEEALVDDANVVVAPLAGDVVPLDEIEGGNRGRERGHDPGLVRIEQQMERREVSVADRVLPRAARGEPGAETREEEMLGLCRARDVCLRAAVLPRERVAEKSRAED